MSKENVIMIFKKFSWQLTVLKFGPLTVMCLWTNVKDVMG